MLRYALMLVDSNYDQTEIETIINNFNAKLKQPLELRELQSTVYTTVKKRLEEKIPITEKGNESGVEDHNSIDDPFEDVIE